MSRDSYHSNNERSPLTKSMDVNGRYTQQSSFRKIRPANQSQAIFIKSSNIIDEEEGTGMDAGEYTVGLEQNMEIS